MQVLKEELQSLKQKSSGGLLATASASGIMDFNSMTKEELAAKVVSYQQFMSKYIVEAQQQKILAVKAAEAAAMSKYEEKLKLLGGSSDSPSTSAPLSRVSPSPETKLYDDRSANVAAAAKAGRSRWGDQEVAKATQAVNGVKVNGVKLPADFTSAPVPLSSTTPTILPGTSLYDSRNAMVAAAGAAGKSRWGEAEIKKATEEAAKRPALSAPSSSSPPVWTAAPMDQIVVTPEIEAADHGLRNDGGVGGPSLAQRVNLGMQLFEGGVPNGALTPPAAIEQGSSAPSLFEARNARVAAAAAAGKSRWGPMENERIAQLVGVAALPSSVGSAAIPPEVIEADHGLRADGGVGGPTLAQRVNLGAKLLGP
jgi:hypothetical protein